MRILAEQAGRLYTEPWDAMKIYGCYCDLGFRGPDCSLKVIEMMMIMIILMIEIFVMMLMVDVMLLMMIEMLKMFIIIIYNVNVDYTSMMLTTCIMVTDDNRFMIPIIIIIYMKSLGMSIQG